MKVILNGDVLDVPAEKEEEVKALLGIPEKPKGRWKPNHADKYWFQDANKECFQSYWANRLLDEKRWAIGNCFRTKEEAEAWDGHKRLAAEQKIRDFIAENGLEFEPDWEDDRQNKYFITYAYGKFHSEVVTATQLQGFPPFRTAGDAHLVIGHCEAELRILWGLK